MSCSSLNNTALKIFVFAVVKILLVVVAKWPQDAGHSWTVNISAKTEEVTLAVGVFSWQAWQCWPQLRLRPSSAVLSSVTAHHWPLSSQHTTPPLPARFEDITNSTDIEMAAILG